MPASRTHRVLGSSQRQDTGLHPGAGLCRSHPQQSWSGSHTVPEPSSREESRVQPASLPHLLRPLRGQQRGDRAATATSHTGAGRVGSVVFGFGAPCCGPQESSGFGSQAPSVVLAAGIALVLGLPVGQGAAAVGAGLCVTSSPCRHPGQRGQAGDGLYPRGLLHGGHGEHDRRQHPGQLRERDCHHPQLPRRSARYELLPCPGTAPVPARARPGTGGGGGPGGMRCGHCPGPGPWQPSGATWHSPQHTGTAQPGPWHRHPRLMYTDWLN